MTDRPLHRVEPGETAPKPDSDLEFLDDSAEVSEAGLRTELTRPDEPTV